MANDNETLPFTTVIRFKDSKSNVTTEVRPIVTTTQSVEKYDPLVFCRTCANVDTCQVPIFSGEGLNYNLSSKIGKYLPIQVSEEDDLPLNVCYHCASTLIAWDTLVLGVVEAEEKLNFIKNSVADKHSEDVNIKDIDDVGGLIIDTDSIQSTDEDPLMFKKDTIETKTINEKRDILQEKNLQSPLESNEIDIQRLMKEPVLSFSTYQHQFTLSRPFIAEMFSLQIDNVFCCKICTMIGNFKIEYLKSLLELKNKTSESIIVESKANDIKVSKSYFEKHKKVKPIESKCCVFCANCGKMFSSKLSLGNHMKTHFDNKTFDCHECGKVFRYRFNLIRHLRVIHEGLRKHVCKDCGKSFRSRGEMEDHQNIHNVKQKIVCEECGRIFLTKASFYPHKKYHHGKKKVKEKHKYTCDKCNKIFTTKKSKNQHMLIHTGEKPIVCSVCGKNFRTKTNLRQHKKIHSDVKPYTCEHCGKAFARKDHLVIHIRSHTGEKPFVCSTCGKGFSQINDKKKHLKIHERNH